MKDKNGKEINLPSQRSLDVPEEIADRLLSAYTKEISSLGFVQDKKHEKYLKKEKTMKKEIAELKKSNNELLMEVDSLKESNVGKDEEIKKLKKKLETKKSKKGESNAF